MYSSTVCAYSTLLSPTYKSQIYRQPLPITQPSSKMCTLEKHGHVFVLTLTGGDEHRLNPTLIGAVQAALTQVRDSAGPGSALVTTAHGKFFSNGFDLNWAQSAGTGFLDRLGEMVSAFDKGVMAELFSLPMPTVAAVNGHASAAGMMLALCHDYVHMRSDRGVMYMSELDIGLPMPETFVGVLRSKLPSPAARRAVVMRAAKVKAEEGLKMGIVDAVHEGVEKTVEAAVKEAEELAARQWNGEIYAGMRKVMFPEAAAALGVAGDGKRSRL